MSRDYNWVYPNHYTHWHGGEIKTLKKLVALGASPKEFESELGRPYHTCIDYYKELDRAERRLKLLKYGSDNDTLISMKQKEKDKDK